MRVPRAVATGTDRVYNFSAGPAAIFEDVLETAQKEMLSWHGSGMSVMEMSHRGKEFMTIIQEAESDLKELLQIPSNYKVSKRKETNPREKAEATVSPYALYGSKKVVCSNHWIFGCNDRCFSCKEELPRSFLHSH